MPQNDPFSPRPILPLTTLETVSKEFWRRSEAEVLFRLELINKRIISELSMLSARQINESGCLTGLTGKCTEIVATPKLKKMRGRPNPSLPTQIKYIRDKPNLELPNHA